jgi:hypothetical protein
LLWVLAPSARILIPFFASAATHARLEWRWQRVVVAIAVVAQLFLAVYFADRSDAFSLLSGQSGDFQYLMKARASFESIQGIDGAVPAASRTLVVGLNETFWFERRVRGGGNFDGPRVSRYLETPTPEALRERLRRDGITHVAVVSIAAPTNVAQKKEERQTTLSPAAQKSLAQLLDRYATNVDAGGNATVFTLR